MTVKEVLKTLLLLHSNNHNVCRCGGVGNEDLIIDFILEMIRDYHSCDDEWAGEDIEYFDDYVWSDIRECVGS